MWTRHGVLVQAVKAITFSVSIVVPTTANAWLDVFVIEHIKQWWMRQQLRFWYGFSAVRQLQGSSPAIEVIAQGASFCCR